MFPELIKYSSYIEQVPASGYHILANQTEAEILVYQAYKNSIADFAISNQYLGGDDFKYSRMSWIKPNFLWMMYRCGWTEKLNQERVLGIWIKKSGFHKILSESVYSSFQNDIYNDQEDWKAQLQTKEVRLQWDPDHDVLGNKEDRRAIQLGIKGNKLQEFGKEMIVKIIDMTEIVKKQKAKIDSGRIEDVLVPKEWIFEVNDPSLKIKLKIDNTATNKNE